MAVVTGLIAGATQGKKIFNIGKNLFGGIFGGSGADRRNEKRKALQRVGFNLVKTPNRSLGTGWNIDDWSDQGLDNLATLYEQFGDPVKRAHNARALDGRTAENINQLRREVEKFSGGNIQDPVMASTSVPGSGAGLFSSQNINGILAGAGILLGGYYILNRKK